jgi:hypothetical protein
MDDEARLHSLKGRYADGKQCSYRACHRTAHDRHPRAGGRSGTQGAEGVALDSRLRRNDVRMGGRPSRLVLITILGSYGHAAYEGGLA